MSKGKWRIILGTGILALLLGGCSEAIGTPGTTQLKTGSEETVSESPNHEALFDPKDSEIRTEPISEPGENSFQYIPGKYKISGALCANRILPENMEDMEKRARTYHEQHDDLEGLILECTVSGPSINRMVEPDPKDWEPGVTYYSNHVLTPVTVEKVIYAEEGNPIRENDTIYIREPFYYYSEESGIYVDSADPDSIFLDEVGAYNPLQAGYRYLIYASCRKDETAQYGDHMVVSTMGLQEAVYCLEEKETATEVVDYYSSDFEDAFYWKIWREVVKKYGSTD